MLMVDREDAPHVFRLHRERVFYMSANLAKQAACIGRKQLLCAGIALGRFSKSRKFRLAITSLDCLARFAPYKVWLKPAGQQAFVYGNHVIKRHIGRMTEATPRNVGVVVIGMVDEIPVGFGVTARTTDETKAADTETVTVFHQADVGEYLRNEEELF
eukprot:GHVT01034126.1.p1 GENE.GHVT01034126.1~~GHVT01034126.1.p1  ORF type:complete len:158 (+),score=32.97 GHVT01034126.1:1112-1585(+)